MTSLEGWGSTIELHPQWSSVTWSSPSLHRATESRCGTRTRRPPTRITASPGPRTAAQTSYDTPGGSAGNCSSPAAAAQHLDARSDGMRDPLSTPSARTWQASPPGMTRPRPVGDQHRPRRGMWRCSRPMDGRRCTKGADRETARGTGTKGSGRQDSNLRSSAPKADALATTLRPGSAPRRARELGLRGFDAAR